jgi:hypothetical protein
MPVDHIRYDLMVRDAMRSVVRRALADAARNGLPGDHHFFISFDTQAPGVKLSPRLLAQYPKEMTIILQHQFWDLTVTDSALEVGLSFNGIPERLGVPFDAIRGFFDPSVQFGLEFTEDGAAAGTDASSEPASAIRSGQPAPAGSPSQDSKPRRAPRVKPAAPDEAPPPVQGLPAKDAPGDDSDKPSGGAEVVRLDRFRKK